MPRRLNGELGSSTVHLPELPLWDVATPKEPFQEPQLLEVDLSHAQHEGMTTAIQAPTTTPVLTHPPADTIEPHRDITMTVNLHLHGALEWLQWALSTASAPVSQCSMPRREPPTAVLGAPPSTEETEDPLWPKEMDSAIPVMMATLTQMPLQRATPDDTPNIPHVTHPLLQPTMPKTPEATSMYMFPPGSYQSPCQINFFCSRRK